jgi:hypothetical protein
MWLDQRFFEQLLEDAQGDLLAADRQRLDGRFAGRNSFDCHVPFSCSAPPIWWVDGAVFQGSKREVYAYTLHYR